MIAVAEDIGREVADFGSDLNGAAASIFAEFFDNSIENQTARGVDRPKISQEEVLRLVDTNAATEALQELLAPKVDPIERVKLRMAVEEELAQAA